MASMSATTSVHETIGSNERRQSAAAGRSLEGVQDGGIPEDDGMHTLREKLHEIRLLAISTDERARRMHQLMTKDYLTRRIRDEHNLEARLDDMAIENPPDSTRQAHLDNPYQLLPGDLELAFSPLPVTTEHSYSNADETIIDEEEEEAPMLGCMHYKRNVKIQCFDCERWYPCRHCHDAARDLPWQHNLNRKKTKNMLCMLCKTPQPAAQVCHKCGEYASWYYCSKCKLWDNDSNKRIYHCDDCGLCRIGEGLGKDFVHCRRCNVCISISTSAAHPCIERATDSDCPLCLSYLFESQTPVISLPCGHYMHGECYKDLMAVTYRCPVCNKSAVNMETQWRKMDDEIAAQPMPEDDDIAAQHVPENNIDQTLGDQPPHIIQGHLAAAEHVTRRPRLVWIGCNDCGGRCHTPFHWLGLKCQVCGGYNTNQMAPLAGRETEAERMLRQQAQPRQHDFTGNFVLRDGGVGAVCLDDDDDEVEEGNSRVDSAYAASSSPSSNTARQLHRRASEATAHSPGRRYFVQLEEPRRSSFTTPRFTAPSMPNLPQLPRMPDMPSLQDMSLPSLPRLPNMANIELPRLSPYDMVAVLSRSLSPMRYYSEGDGDSSTWRNSAPPGTLSPEARQRHRQNSLRVGSEQDSHDPREDEDIFEQLIGHR